VAFSWLVLVEGDGFSIQDNDNEQSMNFSSCASRVCIVYLFVRLLLIFGATYTGSHSTWVRKISRFYLETYKLNVREGGEIILLAYHRNAVHKKLCPSQSFSFYFSVTLETTELSWAHRTIRILQAAVGAQRT